MIRTSELNVSVGVIVVDERLDYETQEMYTFEVSCYLKKLDVLFNTYIKNK